MTLGTINNDMHFTIPLSSHFVKVHGVFLGIFIQNRQQLTATRHAYPSQPRRPNPEAHSEHS